MRNNTAHCRTYATLSRVTQDFISVVNLALRVSCLAGDVKQRDWQYLSKLLLCRCFLFWWCTIGVGLERPFLVSLADCGKGKGRTKG